MGNSVKVCTQETYNSNALLGGFEKLIRLKNDVLGIVYLCLIFLGGLILLSIPCCIIACCVKGCKKRGKRKRVQSDAGPVKNIEELENAEEEEEPMETDMKLNYALTTKENSDQLTVRVHSTSDLYTDSTLKPKTYVFAMLTNDSDYNPKNKHGRRTRTIEFEEDPTWEEDLTFNMKGYEKGNLRFEIYYEDPASKDILLGTYEHDLFNTKPGTREYSVNLYEPSKKDIPFGEMMIVLKYESVQKQLHVTILEAKNLVDVQENGDFFVSVTTHVKKKRIQNLKTSIRKNTKTPNFSEIIIFSVKENKLPSINLTCSLKCKRENKSSCIGRVTFGYNVSNIQAKKHWDALVQNPDKPIGLWHSLYRSPLEE